jgi:hypothetical protein
MPAKKVAKPRRKKRWAKDVRKLTTVEAQQREQKNQQESGTNLFESDFVTYGS